MDAKDFLRGIRAAGLTQVEVAERTGITQSTISKIERGEVKDVMSKNYRALQALHAEVQTTRKDAPPIAEKAGV